MANNQEREVGEGKKDGNNVDDRKRNTEEEGGHSFICFIFNQALIDC